MCLHDIIRDQNLRMEISTCFRDHQTIQLLSLRNTMRKQQRSGIMIPYRNGHLATPMSWNCYICRHIKVNNHIMYTIHRYKDAYMHT